MKRSRRRYDTVELVAQLRQERRMGVLLGSIGLGLIVFLLALYLSGLGRDDLPVVPAAAAPMSPLPAMKDPPNEQAPSPNPSAGVGQSGAVGSESESEDKQAEERDQKATSEVRITVKPKAAVWIDGNKVGKLKKHVASLPAGDHTFLMKLGRRTVEHTVTVERGKRVLMRVDMKRKKVQTKFLSE